MSFEIYQDKKWVIFSIKERLDAFNYQEFKAEMDKILREKKTSHVALQLSHIHFLSLPTMKYFSEVAQQLVEQGGKLALVGTPEKIRRQIDIFATLKTMLVFRSEEDWENYNH